MREAPIHTSIFTVSSSGSVVLLLSPPTSQTGGEEQWHYETFTFRRCLLLSKRRCTRLTWGAGAGPNFSSTTFSTGGFLRECHITMRH
jgi:hypothetical protein